MVMVRGERGYQRQRTLKRSIYCVGIGLHSGARASLTIHPADADAGIRFRRTDRAGNGAEIPALWNRVVDTRLCTVLGTADGVTVGTVEHLMAALRGCEIDNAVIEVDGPEVPVMDGSSEPFVFLIDAAGTVAQDAPRRVIRVLKPVEVGDETRTASLTPGPAATLSFDIEFPSAAIGRQQGSVALANGAFRDELARARTFGFLHEVEQLRRMGLARGGSLDNAIVIDGDRVVNEGGLRFADEFVRHKMLDSIGDLFLAGAPIIGHYHGVRAGHALTNTLLHALFADPTAWTFDRADPATTTPTAAPWAEAPRLVANG